MAKGEEKEPRAKSREQGSNESVASLLEKARWPVVHEFALRCAWRACDGEAAQGRAVASAYRALLEDKRAWLEGHCDLHTLDRRRLWFREALREERHLALTEQHPMRYGAWAHLSCLDVIAAAMLTTGRCGTQTSLTALRATVARAASGQRLKPSSIAVELELAWQREEIASLHGAYEADCAALLRLFKRRAEVLQLQTWQAALEEALF
jgi:hypothetical protein